MLVQDKLDKALTLVVPTVAIRDYNHSDTVKLMESYKIIELAKDDFLNGLITFEEYICLCEKHEINVDSYMETIEHNLIHFQLM